MLIIAAAIIPINVTTIVNAITSGGEINREVLSYVLPCHFYIVKIPSLS